MISPACFCIGFEHAQLPGQFFVFFNTILIVIRIHKFLPRIVRRININHFDLSRIWLTEKFEHFQIVPFQIQVFGCIPVNAFLFAGTERPQRRSCRRPARLSLAFPLQTKEFVVLRHIVAQHLTQGVKVNFPFPNDRGEKRCKGIHMIRNGWFGLGFRRGRCEFLVRHGI